ncbi:MAG: heme biosynthesis HemY N-terminal domain-containing protein, partial [Propylenella sp.]
MIRFLILLAILFAAALGFTWLKRTPGEVALSLGDTVYAIDLTTAIIALFVTILLGMTAIWFFREVLRAPWRLARLWRQRGVERGRVALSEGLIAIAAGDLRTAERATQDAARRLPDQPLTRLLRAQTAQLKGNRTAAREIFQEMTEHSETRIAGLRGLYVEAEREGEHIAAHQIAERARSEAPSAPWAARALLRHQTAAADWDGALQT